jgi:hypothetical protein
MPIAAGVEQLVVELKVKFKERRRNEPDHLIRAFIEKKVAEVRGEQSRSWGRA